MRSRESLIRLHRFQLDEKRRQVTSLETIIDEFRQKENELEQQIADEQKRSGVSDVTHYAYSTFAKAAGDRRDKLLKSIEEFTSQLDEAKEELAEAFNEMKKYELMEEKEGERVKGERNAAEQAELDATAQTIHSRDRLG